MMCGMRQLLGSAGGRLWQVLAARLPVGAHTYTVLAEMAGFLGRVYQMYWWAVVVIVLLVPTRADQLTFYFPAVLGLAATWLFAMPAYAQGLVASSADFSALRPSPNMFRDFIARMRTRPVQLPAVFEDDAQVAEASAMMAAELPALVPSTLLVIVTKLSTRVVGTGIVATVGLLAGPWLASIHVSRLHDWSPIAILYALSTPVLPFLLGSLLVPFLGYTYLASRRAELEIEPTPRGNSGPLRRRGLPPQLVRDQTSARGFHDRAAGPALAAPPRPSGAWRAGIMPAARRGH